MFFGIASHSVRKRLKRFHLRPVQKETTIEVVHLLLQLSGMGMTGGRKLPFVFGFVATEQQQVGNAKELKIDEHIFCFFACEAAANDMRHHRNFVFVLNSGSNGHRSGAMSFGNAFEKAVSSFFKNKFASMCGDVDVFRIELPQSVDGAIHTVDAVAFEGR